MYAYFIGDLEWVASKVLTNATLPMKQCFKFAPSCGSTNGAAQKVASDCWGAHESVAGCKREEIAQILPPFC